MRTLLSFAFLTLVSCSIDDKFIAANRWFSASIYKKFSKQPGNFLLSPFSLETILALTQLGCEGQTAQELVNVLNFTDDPLKTGTIFERLFPLLDGYGKYKTHTGDGKYEIHTTNNSHGTYKIHTANKIYVKDNLVLNPEFQQVARRIFRADTQNVDFGRRRQAALTMNQWVEHQTNNKIRNLVDSYSLNDRTRAVLVNAVYFKGNWSRPFYIAYSKKLDFYLNPEEVVPVDVMLLHDKTYNYFESPALKAKFLEMPFKGDNASMVVVLPDEIDGLPFVEKHIRKVLQKHKFSGRNVNLGLPRFKIETSVDFKKILKQMGVTKIFSDQFADLSGIAGEKGDLVIDKISQKSFIDVSEEGVEAAAATYTLIAIPMSAPSQDPVNFRINRPFIFYIKVKDVIIFVGRVVDPRN